VVKAKLGPPQWLKTKVTLVKNIFGSYFLGMILGSSYRLYSGSEATKQFLISQYRYHFYESLPKKARKMWKETA